MKNLALFALLLVPILVLTGCIRTYTYQRERLDQDLAVGNRGVIMGPVGPAPERVTKPTRTIMGVDIDYKPIEYIEKEKEIKRRGYKPSSIERETEVIEIPGEMYEVGRSTVTTEPLHVEKEALTEYMVKKGDTLQKISSRFFGTTRKWGDIYKANRDRLKGPDKIYPGQVIVIPLEGVGAQEDIK